MPHSARYQIKHHLTSFLLQSAIRGLRLVFLTSRGEGKRIPTESSDLSSFINCVVSHLPYIIPFILSVGSHRFCLILCSHCVHDHTPLPLGPSFRLSPGPIQSFPRHPLARSHPYLAEVTKSSLPSSLLPNLEYLWITPTCPSLVHPASLPRDPLPPCLPDANAALLPFPPTPNLPIPHLS